MAKVARPFGVMHDTVGDAETGRFAIRKIYWIGATDAAHDLAIKNGAGTVILAVKAGTDLRFMQDWPFGNQILNGFETDVLDSGTVEYVYA
jgi:hypothetical protein